MTDEGRLHSAPADELDPQLHVDDTAASRARFIRLDELGDIPFSAGCKDRRLVALDDIPDLDAA